jgi:hypothetical protein
MSTFSDPDLQAEFAAGIHDDAIDTDPYESITFKISMIKFVAEKMLDSIKTGSNRDELFDYVEGLKLYTKFSETDIKCLTYLSDNKLLKI